MKKPFFDSVIKWGRLFGFLFLLLFFANAAAQVPEGIPNKPYYIDTSNPFDIIVFFVIPVLLVGFYVFWRRKYRK